MNIEKSTQVMNYFELRNVNHSMYSNSTLPLWIKNEIIDEKSRILDYGCGFGQNMRALQDESFQNCCGVDIEKNAIEYCLSSNLNVKKLNLNDLKNPFNFKFDIIILSHVIEHVPKNEIINTLAMIKKYFLTEKGVLLLAVPNAQSNTGCYWAYEDWTHATLFTSGSLYYVLKAAGFKNIEFLDVDCTLGSSTYKVIIRKLFLNLYKINKIFWNKVTCSSYHKPSTQIYSYEIKVKAY